MKKNELQELRVKEAKEIDSLVAKKRTELDEATIDLVAGRTKNVHTAANLRKEIAQILTIAKNKKMEAKTEE